MEKVKEVKKTTRIEIINELIEKLRKSKDYSIYEDLVFELHYFSIEVAGKRERIDVSISNMEFEKASYQIKNRDKYNSDRTASSYFKKDNYDKLNTLEIKIAEVELLETLVNRYDKIQKYFNDKFWRDSQQDRITK